MNAFPVWIRQYDSYCRVCVDGIENARWLLRELDGSFVFPRGDGIVQDARSTLCVFHVVYNWPLTRAHFLRRLHGIQAVNLTCESERIQES